MLPATAATADPRATRTIPQASRGHRVRTATVRWVAPAVTTRAAPRAPVAAVAAAGYSAAAAVVPAATPPAPRKPARVAGWGRAWPQAARGRTACARATVRS